MSSMREVVSPVLLDVLRQLRACPLLGSFYLVGGTALALRLHHRRSVDIDLFTHHPFDSQAIADWVIANTAASELETGKNLVRCFIAGVKMDVIAHQYPLLEPVQQFPLAADDADRFPVASLNDIAAMKLNAVANRGARKDFWDVAVLLDHFSLAEMLGLHARKYRVASQFATLKSLCYFVDADAEATPIYDFTGMSWEKVKAKIREASESLAKSEFDDAAG